MKTWADFGIVIPAGVSGEYATTCPECSSQRKKKGVKCLSVNVAKEVFHCNHCEFSGTLKSGRDRATEIHWNKPAYRIPTPRPVETPTEKMLEWFSKRGIGRKVLERNQVSTCEIYMPQLEEDVRAVRFPYFRAGVLVNCKYRDNQKNFRLEAGAERILYGLDDIGETLIWVEGEIDKLSVEQAGFVSCVSVPDGAPSETAKDYSNKFSFLEAGKEKLGKVREHVLAVDNDGPGRKLEEELARRLGREKCRRVQWPAGCKDANDVLIKHGERALSDCLSNAQPYPVEGVFSVIGESDKIVKLYEDGYERGVSTGWSNLDEIYTVRPGELTVVTGIPGSGKSNLMDCLMVNIARQQGWRFAIFSPENQPLQQHMASIIEKWAGMPFNKGPQERMGSADVTSGLQWSNEHFDWILPGDDTAWTIEHILDVARQLVYRNGIRGLVIDPWNELEHLRPEGMTETEYVSRSLKHVRQFARNNAVHVWVVAHPTKLTRNKDGNYPLPTLYDVSGSSNFRNKADNGLVIWRDFNEPNKPVEVHTAKIRFRHVGKIGSVNMKYHAATATYTPEVPAGWEGRREPYSN